VLAVIISPHHRPDDDDEILTPTQQFAALILSRLDWRAV